MNTHALAADIVTRIRNSMQDSVLNQQLVVERLIREAIADDEAEALDEAEIRDALNASQQ
jgi:hypothetical protein